jgi:CheY-like chemotaxis protein
MSSKTILLVEDLADDSELVALALRKVSIPCQLAVVRDGVELVDYLFQTGGYARREGSLPHLILLDLKMPRMSGLQVLQMLRRIRWEDRENLPPVVVFTSSCDEQDLARAYHLGAHSCVRKPVDFVQFTEVLRILATYWLEINVPPLATDRLRAAGRAL